MGQRERLEAGVSDHRDVSATVAEAQDGVGVGNHFAAHVQIALQFGTVQHGAARLAFGPKSFRYGLFGASAFSTDTGW